jgi:hypothetical protein
MAPLNDCNSPFVEVNMFVSIVLMIPDHVFAFDQTYQLHVLLTVDGLLQIYRNGPSKFYYETRTHRIFLI